MEYTFKGTPGAWRSRMLFANPIKSEDESYEHNSAWIFSGDKLLADAKYSTQSNDGGWPQVSMLSEFEANAHLIAAAPDLLDALIKVHRIAKQCDLLETLGEEEHEYMQKAIEKALNIQP